ncbi:MAG: TRAM domain-containing protein, partial [Lachnospiraceae bacterium]|nr:TRAM domain-containing protein [Lachnospiraceae bacterium]
IRRVEYDNAFTFIYSKRTGTPAASMENQVPEEESHKQFDRVLAEVQKYAKKQSSRFEGRVMEALVEEVNENDSSLVTGRLSNNIIVHFPGSADMVGKYVNVKLNECKGFYYLGEAVCE